jgi:hypothetical protein
MAGIVASTASLLRRCIDLCKKGATPTFAKGLMRMSTFDDRENAFENKFAHDEEMKFKAEARCNKLLGLWAAELLGKSGSDAEAYAKEVIIADFEEAGHEDVVRKVAGDLEGKADADAIRAKRAELLVIAKEQVMNEV